MANDLLTVDVDATAVLRALSSASSKVQAVVNREAKYTAERIRHAADHRAATLFPGRSGLTREGIKAREAEGGNGWVVVAERNPYQNLPLWLDKGTTHMTAREFFDISADLERGPHERRLRQALVESLGE